MSWLKIDDGFTQHPKLAGWTPAQKWAWLEVLTYCARYDTHGRIPTDLGLMPRSTTPALLAKAEKAGLIDRADDGGQVVHDWPIYNAKTVGEKVAYYLAKHPDASANDVYKALGGSRDLVLQEVARQKQGGTKPGTENGTPEPGKGGTGRTTKPGTESGSETGTKPGPSPGPSLNSSDRSEGTHASKLNGHKPIEKILAWGERDFTDGGEFVRKLLRNQPEVVQARLAEALRGKGRGISNRAAYLRTAIEREIEQRAENMPLPGEPD